MAPVEELLAIEEIKRLKARYFRLMDTKQWETLGDVFTEDAIFDVGGALEEAPADRGEPVRGREAIVAYIRAGLTPLTSVHYGHMPEIEIVSDDEARGIWPFCDILRPADGVPFRLFYGYGHYHETYRRAGGHKDGSAWRIAALKITRLMVKTE